MAHFGRPSQQCDERGLAGFVGGRRRVARAEEARRSQTPLKLDFTGAGHVRGLLVLEEGASLTLVEGVSAADFRNVGFEIVLGRNASLEHVRISPEAADAVLVEEVSLSASPPARRYRGHFASFGGKLSRMELEIALEGEGAAGASLRRVGAGWQAPQPTSPPMSSIAMATPTAPSCSSMWRRARRAPSIRAR